jgi:hypothetical protein
MTTMTTTTFKQAAVALVAGMLLIGNAARAADAP